MRKPIDLTGQRFGKLVAIERHAKFKEETYYTAQCDCGNLTRVRGKSLKCGNTKSCGCIRLKNAKKHGLHGTPTYITWRNMRQRCNNPRKPDYKWYGAKGVKVCKRWDRFENFVADMGVRPDGMTLDRINPEGDYEKDNCRWADWETQANNKRCQQ